MRKNHVSPALEVTMVDDAVLWLDTVGIDDVPAVGGAA